MNVLQYLQAKYRQEIPTTISYQECKIFGISWQPEKGWLKKYGSIEITQEMGVSLKETFEKKRQTALQNKNDRNLFYANAALKAIGCNIDDVVLPIREKSKKREKKKKVKVKKSVVAKQNKNPSIDPNSSEFLFSWEWRTLRMKVLVKYGATCMCCGATKDDGVKIHVDHIKPRSKFPKLALVEDNLQVLCDVCNQGKSNIDMTDWRPKGGTGYDPAKQFGEFMQINGK